MPSASRASSPLIVMMRAGRPGMAVVGDDAARGDDETAQTQVSAGDADFLTEIDRAQQVVGDGPGHGQAAGERVLGGLRGGQVPAKAGAARPAKAAAAMIAAARVLVRFNIAFSLRGGI